MKPEQLPTPPQQPPTPPEELPAAITDVDRQISREFAAMHPIGSIPKKRRLPGFVGYIGDGFKYHKVIAFPVLIGFILITGTVTTLALTGGGNSGGEKLAADTSQQNNGGTSTRDDPASNGDDTTSEDDASLTDEELEDVALDPEFDILSEDDESDSDLFYEPEEPMDPGGPIEDPSVPADPPDTTPPSIPDTPPPTPPSIPPSVAMASFNYASWKPVTGISAAIQNLGGKADVVGLQEFGASASRDALVRAVRDCTACGYALYMPATSNGGSVPIIWKKDTFQLLSKGNVKVYDAQKVESAAGSTNTPAKFITWIRLKHITSGRVFYFVNTQLISAVEKNGSPDRTMPKRLALYEKHLGLLATKITQFKQNDTPVIVSGDFNVDYGKDRQTRYALFPYAKMDSVSTWANWRYLGAPEGGSQGTRLIDYVFASRTAKVVPKSAQILPTYGSDHHAVRMVVQLK